MSTALDVELDFGLLAGEMEAPRCESPHHTDGESHDDGPATHYMLIGHTCYGPVDEVIPVCGAYAKHWTDAGKVRFCHWCRQGLQPEDFNSILGPIGI